MSIMNLKKLKYLVHNILKNKHFPMFQNKLKTNNKFSFSEIAKLFRCVDSFRERKMVSALLKVPSSLR